MPHGDRRDLDSRKAGGDPASCYPSRCLNLLRYWLYEPVCWKRVAAASFATLLPLWNVAALASGAMAADRVRAAKAARIRFFILILHLWSGGMSGFDGAVNGPSLAK
jgi:hypothetical protein